MSEEFIGPYRVLSPIKRGGGGSVYVGFDRRLSRRVALKFLPIPEFSEARSHLIAEAQSLAQLNHRLIVQIYDVVELAENLVLVLEYVEGIDLAELANACSLEPQEVLQIGIEISGALAAVHERGIVHRDIKPSNVLLNLSGHVKLTDFGIAVGPEIDGGADNRSGSYSALTPEQVLGKVPSARSDLFSFGAMLYFLLSGFHPFGNPDHPQQLIARLAVGEYQPLGQRKPDLLPALASLVDELLATSANDRPESAVVVRQRLAAMRGELPFVRGQSLLRKVANCARPEDAVLMEAGLPRRSGQGARSHLLTDRQWRPWVAELSRDSKWLVLSGFLLLLLLAGVMRESGRWKFESIDVSLQRPQVCKYPKQLTTHS